MKKTTRAARLIALTLLALVIALALTGCGEEITAAVTAQLEANEQAASEPEVTMGPMTSEMFTDRKAVYQYYDQVSVGDTLETVTERFGEPTIRHDDNGDSYVWQMDDGYGVVCIFFESGKLRAKGVYYEDLRQFGLLSNSTSIENFTQLNSNYTFEMTCGVLGGRAMEILQIVQDTSADPEVKRVFVWSNEKGDIIQVLFSGSEKLESVTYSLADEQ